MYRFSYVIMEVWISHVPYCGFGLQIEHLNHLLATKDEYKKFTQPIRLPLDMSKKVVGISQGYHCNQW